jgi:hypothetical protein
MDCICGACRSHHNRLERACALHLDLVLRRKKMTTLDWLLATALLAVACIPLLEWTRGRGKYWEPVGLAAGCFHIVVVTGPGLLLIGLLIAWLHHH